MKKINADIYVSDDANLIGVYTSEGRLVLYINPENVSLTQGFAQVPLSEQQNVARLIMKLQRDIIMDQAKEKT